MFLVKGYLRCTAFCCENLLESICFAWSAYSEGPEIVSLWIRKNGEPYNSPDQVLMRVLSPNGEVFMTLLLKCVRGE